MAIAPAELESALGAYGLVADRVRPMPAHSPFVNSFRVSAGREYVLRVRDARATPGEVLFAARWAQTVVGEVPVPVGLLPASGVPRLAGRCVDVCNYIPHDDTNGGQVEPVAWVTIGYWLGCLHRLGKKLVNEAPADLYFGNYAGSQTRVATCLVRARQVDHRRHEEELDEMTRALERAEAFLHPRRSILPIGVVHGDLHFWNVLYTRGSPVAIVDLDSLQKGYLIADLAYASIWLAGWQRERRGAWSDIQTRYLAAYIEGRREPLSQVERECLGWMGVMYSVFFFAQNLAKSGDDEESWRGDLESARRQMTELLDAG